MNLRTHFLGWIWRPDPFYEAWKDDPFVEMVAARSGSWPFRGNSWLRANRKLIPHFLATLALLGILIFLMSAGEDWAGNERYLLGAFIFATGYLITKAKEAQSRSGPVAFIHDTAMFHSYFVDLWLCGSRGRDIAKALYVSKGPGIHWGALICLILPTAIAVGYLMSVIFSDRDFDIFESLFIIVLMSWPVCVCRRLMMTRSNPFQTMEGLPDFLAPLEKLPKDRDTDQLDPIPLSLAVIVGVALLCLLIWSPGRGLHYFPEVFLIFTAGVMVANYMVLSKPHETATSIKQKLESRFSLVDRKFDSYIRERIIQDPDAQRSQ